MDYQTKVNATKEAAVKQLKDEFGQYSGFIFADYRGLTVAQLSDLRKQLRTKDAACRIVIRTMTAVMKSTATGISSPAGDSSTMV